MRKTLLLITLLFSLSTAHANSDIHQICTSMGNLGVMVYEKFQEGMTLSELMGGLSVDVDQETRVLFSLIWDMRDSFKDKQHVYETSYSYCTSVAPGS